VFAETIFMSVAASAILVAQLVASGSTFLLKRRLGLDEIITEMLVLDPDVKRSLRAITGGLDTNPPAYHLLLRMLRPIVAPRAEVALRFFSVAAALVALVGLYATLRQIYAPVIALATVLAIWSHPLLQRCAFEGRMYTSWLAAVVWCAYLLSRLATGLADDRVLHALLAGVAVLTCMLHTLGPLSLLLVLGGHLFFNGVDRSSADAVMWAGVGPIVFAGWMPVVWKQSVANPVSWVSPATTKNVADFTRAVLIPPGLATLLLLSGGSALFLQGHLPVESGPPGLVAASVLGGLAGSLAMPLALIVLSLTLEPLLVDRYALPVVVGFAPLIAAVIAPLPPVPAVLLIGVLALTGAYHLRSLHAEYRDRDRVMTRLIAAIERHAGQSVVYFERLHELAVVSRYRPSGRYVAIDVADNEATPGQSVRVPTSNQARLISRYYAGVTVIPWHVVRTLPELYVVPSTLTSSERELAQLERRYPEFDVLSLQAGLYRLVEKAHAVTANQTPRVEAPVGGLRPEAAATNETATGTAPG